MSKGDVFENDCLKLVFNGTPIANLADNAASSPLTSFYIALHIADPGEAGNQSSNEISYTGYARVAVNRNSGGFVVTGSTVSPASDIAFARMTGGTGGTANFASIGTALVGAGKILYSGPLTPSIVVTIGVPPIIPAGGSSVVED